MGYSSERGAIETRWASLWVDGSPADPRTPTRYESLPGFNPPSDAPWAALFILGGEARQASLGAPGDNFWRTASAISIQLYVPLAIQDGLVASRRLDALADHAAAIFRGQTFAGIRCGAPWKGPNTNDDPWLMATVSVPISRDSVF